MKVHPLSYIADLVELMVKLDLPRINSIRFYKFYHLHREQNENTENK